MLPDVVGLVKMKLFHMLERRSVPGHGASFKILVRVDLESERSRYVEM